MSVNMKSTILGTMALVATAFTGTELLTLGKGGKTLTETAYDAATEYVETQKAIKAEGIQAKSYAEAKMQLDSLRDARLFVKYGITPPNANDTGADSISKSLKLMSAISEETHKKFEEIMFAMDCLCFGIKSEDPAAKQKVFLAKCEYYGVDPNDPEAEAKLDKAAKEEYERLMAEAMAKK